VEYCYGDIGCIAIVPVVAREVLPLVALVGFGIPDPSASYEVVVVGVSIAGVVVALFAGASRLAFGLSARTHKRHQLRSFRASGRGLTLESCPIGGWRVSEAQALWQLHPIRMACTLPRKAPAPNCSSGRASIGSCHLRCALLLSFSARPGVADEPGDRRSGRAVLVNPPSPSLVNLGSPITVESWLLLTPFAARR
jgi:hypothetical protein